MSYALQIKNTEPHTLAPACMPTNTQTGIDICIQFQIAILTKYAPNSLSD